MLKQSNNIFLIVIFAIISLAVTSALIIQYWLGHEPCKLCLYQRIPYFLAILLIIKIFEIYGYENPNFLKEKFSTKGGFASWLGILFTAGFTPLPFKLLTISSGFIHFNIFFFIIICVVTRGLRFFLVAFLTYKYGKSFGPFLEKKGAQWTIIIAGAIIVLAAAIYFMFLK